MSTPVITAARRTAPQRRWIERRWPTALGLGATVSTLTLLLPLPEAVQFAVTAWTVLLAAVIYLTWGAARGQLTERAQLRLQTAGVLGFGAVAVTAVALDGDLARYLLAAAWLGHAAWDAYHHRVGRAVPRWYAEACLASDVLVAASLIIRAG